MITRIFSRSADGETFGFPEGVDFEWFPEVGEMYGRPMPIHPAVQIKNCPRLVGKTFPTLSEHIILWFLREIAEGRMEPDDVQLWCDGHLIRIDKDGELIDKWPGGFFRERAALLFGESE